MLHKCKLFIFVLTLGNGQNTNLKLVTKNQAENRCKNDILMVTLSKELFIDTIEAVRLQIVQDAGYSENLAEVLNLGEDGVPLYDNTRLIHAILSLLHIYFPRTEDFCPIEHYMFEMNFGKIGGSDFVSPEDLWYELTKNKGL